MVEKAALWDASHMSEPIETPLQAFVRKAVEAAPRARGYYDKRIQEISGTTGKPLYDLGRGKGLKPSVTMLGHIARVLEQPADLLRRAAEGEQVEPLPQSSLTQDDEIDTPVETPEDAVDVQEWNFAYGMGGGTYLDLPVTGQLHQFSRSWLRQFTHAPPNKIFLARGTGDSMMPTILDADIVLIDTSQNEVRTGDRIWAVAYGQTGLIKRLRPMPDGSVKILSDNPAVPPETAYDGELTVIGRVVAVVRKT